MLPDSDRRPPGAAPARRRRRRDRRRLPRPRAGQPGHVPAARPRRPRRRAVSAGCCARRCGSASASSAGPFRSLAGIAVEPRAYQLVPLLMALRQDTGPAADRRRRRHRQDDRGRPDRRRAARPGRRAAAWPCSARPALAEQWQARAARQVRHRRRARAARHRPPPGTRPAAGRVAVRPVPARRRLHRLHQVPTAAATSSCTRCPELVIVDEAHTCVADGTGGRSRPPALRAASRGLAADAEPAPDPGHRHPALAARRSGFRNLLGLLDPDLATVDLDTDAGPRAARPPLRPAPPRRHPRLPRRGHAVPRGPADPGTALPALPRLPGAVRRRARLRPRDRSATPTAASCGSGSAGGRRSRCCARWPPPRAPPPRPCAPAPRTPTPTTWTRPTRSAGPPCSTCPTTRPSSPPTPPPAPTPTTDATATPPHRRRLRALRRPRRRAGGPERDAKLAAARPRSVNELLADGYNPIVFCRFIATAEYVAEHLAQRARRTTSRSPPSPATLPPAEREARIAELTERRRPAPGAGRHRLPVRGRQPAGALRRRRPLRPGLEPDPARAARGPRRPLRPARARSSAPSPSTAPTTASTGSSSTCCSASTSRSARPLGVSVPVPDRSDAVVEAILEGLLLRDATRRAARARAASAWNSATDLHRDWDSAAAARNASPAPSTPRPASSPTRSPASSPRSAPASAPPARSSAFTARGAARPARRHHPPPTTASRAATGAAARRPARRAGHRPRRAAAVPPRPARPAAATASLARTDPNVAAIARYVLESRARPARCRRRCARPGACGVMRTAAVAPRTTLLLVRFRFHLALPGRDGPPPGRRRGRPGPRLRGRADEADWLAAAEVQALLAAAADRQRRRPTRPATSPSAPWPTLPALHAAPGRRRRRSRRPSCATPTSAVREAGGQRARRQIAVRAQKPADILGVYVYLPAAGGARHDRRSAPLKIVGGLLPADLLGRVFAGDPQVPGTGPHDLRPRRGESVRAAGVPVLALPAGGLAGLQAPSRQAAGRGRADRRGSPANGGCASCCASSASARRSPRPAASSSTARASRSATGPGTCPIHLLGWGTDLDHTHPARRRRRAPAVHGAGTASTAPTPTCGRSCPTAPRCGCCATRPRWSARPTSSSTSRRSSTASCSPTSSCST